MVLQSTNEFSQERVDLQAFWAFGRTFFKSSFFAREGRVLW